MNGASLRTVVLRSALLLAGGMLGAADHAPWGSGELAGLPASHPTAVGHSDRVEVGRPEAIAPARVVSHRSAAAPARIPSGGSEGIAPDRVAVGRSAAIAPAHVDAMSLAKSLARAELAPPQQMPGARILLVPHHAPAGHLTAGAIRDLAATHALAQGGNVRTVVVIGPDHANSGARAATTSAARWTTPMGRVAADVDVVDRLLRTRVATEDPTLLAAEHAMGEVVPYIARYLPAAAVVPMVVRADANRRERGRLTTALLEVVDNQTVVILSADLAHDALPHVARRHDAETLAALGSLDVASIATFGDEHLDARAATAIVVELARGLGATRFVVRKRLDGGALPGYAGGPVTSYATGYYARP